MKIITEIYMYAHKIEYKICVINIRKQLSSELASVLTAVSNRYCIQYKYLYT